MRYFRSCILAALLLCQSSVLAQNDRILRRLDFEERKLGNVEDLPMHWTKVQGVQFPHYVNGHLANDRARSGQYAFRFDLNGGSLVYRYDPVRVVPHCYYRVETFVQTTALMHARARLTAYFVDQDRRPIKASIHHSGLFASGSEDSDWHHLEIELAAGDQADSLVVELELLQPAVYQPDTLGGNAIFPQDIRGSAWFDDLQISQVPKIKMFTDHPGNIFRPREPLSLRVVIIDRSTDDLSAQLVIRDAEASTVYQHSGVLDDAATQTLTPGQKQIKLMVPELKAGWYRATLRMSSQGQFVGEQELDLVLLADAMPNPRPDDRFGVIATDIPFEEWNDLPAILPCLGVGRVKLAVWNSAGDIQETDPAAFDKLLVRLQEIGVTPTACLVAPPPSLAKKIGGDAWTQLLKAKPQDWQPQLAYLVSRHANHLDRWQLGEDGTDAFVDNPAMRQVYQLLYGEFAKLIQKPDLAMPWPAWYEMDGRLPATVALSVQSSVLPRQLPLYMQDINRHQGHNLSLTFNLLDAQRYGRNVQIRDLAQRTVYALAAGASRIDMPLPLAIRRNGDHLEKEPLETLMVVRTLAMTLGGAQFKGKVPLADDVEAFLFEKSNQGILAVWQHGPNDRVHDLAITLGDHPRAVDVWGNSMPLVRPGSLAQMGEKVRVPIGPMPMFLVDIDPALAQLRASVAIDRPLLESSFKPHARKVRFVNPWRTAIAGTLKLKAPPGWTITPPTMQFNINPGETFEREVMLEFPYNSYAGPKTLMAEFRLLDQRISSILVPITLNLGLSDVGMQTMAMRDGKDVLVQQVITNYGDKPINYTAFAIFPGHPRQERLVSGLGAGHTTIKLYRFANVKPEKANVRTGVKEMEGTRILNEEVEVQ